MAIRESIFRPPAILTEILASGAQGNIRQTSVIYNNVREAAEHHLTLLKVGRNV